MSSQKTGKMMIVAGAALYGCGCFVQPGQQPKTPTAAELAQVSYEQMPMASSFEEPQANTKEASSTNWEGIAAGVALGLIVGFAGGSPAKAAGGPAVFGMFEDKNDRCRIDDGCTGAKLKDWAKRQFKREETEGAYKQDPKYSTASTGVGRYRLYGLDYASPIDGNGLGQPNEGYDGTYTIHERRHPWTGYFDYAPGFDEENLKRFDKFLNKGGFTWKNAPYKWDHSVWEK